MIKVKFFGLVRLDYKISELELEPVENIKELLSKIAEKTNIELKYLERKAIYVNSRDMNSLKGIKTKLKDGDEVLITSPVAGG